MHNKIFLAVATKQANKPIFVFRLEFILSDVVTRQ